MLKSGSQEIAQTHSHQSAMIHHIAEAVHLLGLKVRISGKRKGEGDNVELDIM